MDHLPTAFVTGATEGIGRAIAFALGRAGYRLGLCARTAPRLELLVTELRAEGITATGHQADVGDEAQVASAIQEVTATLGPIDTLVNNAGIARLRPFGELTLDDIDATLRTNVRGLFVVTQAVLPHMRHLGRGTIVNIASLSGHNGFAGGSVYAASKHAMLGFSRSLMLELRPEHIRVVAICPGSVDTQLWRNQDIVRREPARMLRPEDIADTVLYALALPERALVSELDIRPSNP